MGISVEDAVKELQARETAVSYTHLDVYKRQDVDDLILNTLGAAIGYMLFVVCNYLRRKRYGEKI